MSHVHGFDYARSLLAFAVVALSVLVIRPAPFLVRLLSDYSLGIYCVHVFVKSAGFITAVPFPFLRCLAVMGASIALIAFLRHSLARRMI